MPAIARTPCPPYSYSAAVVAGNFAFLGLHRGFGAIFFDHFSPEGFPARMTATTEFCDADCLVMIDGVARNSLTRMGPGAVKA